MKINEERSAKGVWEVNIYTRKKKKRKITEVMEHNSGRGRYLTWDEATKR